MSLYIRVSTQIITDAKILAAGPESFTLWIKGLAYSKEHLTDGFVPDECLPILTIGLSDPKSAVERLVTVGLWETVAAGHTVGLERWSHWQTTKDEVDSKRDADRKRKAEWRQNKKVKADSRVPHLSQCDTPCDIDGTCPTCPTNVPSTEHRAQSTEHRARAQETRGITAAPPKDLPTVSPSTPPPPPHRSTGSNGEFMLAVGLLQELKLASTTSDIGIVAQVINLETPEHGGEMEAAEFIKQRARAAQSRGEPVTVFWIKDRKFAQENPNGTNQRNATSPAHERVCRTKSAFHAAAELFRGSAPGDATAADGGPVPTPGPKRLGRGVPVGLPATSTAVLAR